MVKNLLYWRQCVCQCYKRKLDSLVIRLQSRKKFKVKVGTMKPHMNIHSNCSKCCLAKLCCIMIIIYIELRKNIFVTLVIWERIREEKEKNVSWLSHQAIELLFQNLELLHSMLYTEGPSYGSENKKNTMNFEYALSFVLALPIMNQYISAKGQ